MGGVKSYRHVHGSKLLIRWVLKQQVDWVRQVVGGSYKINIKFYKKEVNEHGKTDVYFRS